MDTLTAPPARRPGPCVAGDIGPERREIECEPLPAPAPAEPAPAAPVPATPVPA
ncbi:hypothetical protein SAMN06893096_103355 [Geodermatophilus pulveris]|uniref:Uncharacterized protein n=1 Tax=Geodermatophilus pulveris TaxID=1564159 RepID=A0A239DTM0_9ACTN|nr:hypothetical protein [Geodermatophilus pulveris]SNS35589.1 hypothetical protein SAMN06893096_103355 [Geodermatophilus pulveris]